MSNAQVAIALVLKQEGGFVNSPVDPGGATKYGISLRFLEAQPDSVGDINHDGIVDINDIRGLTAEKATELFYLPKWIVGNYRAINDQIIANKVFSLAVNMGQQQAMKLLQRATWAVYGTPKLLDDDGALGQATLNLINKINPTLLLVALKAEAAGFYRLLAKLHPAEGRENIDGWLNRAYA